MSRSPHRWMAAALAAAAAALLLFNVAAHLRTIPIHDGLAPRFWNDVSIAAHFMESGGFPLASYQVRHTAPSRDPRFEEFRRNLIEAVVGAGASPGRPTVTVDPEHLTDQPIVVARSDDPGRALVLGLLYRCLGGVAPYLLFWVGPIAVLPLLAWVGWELLGAGWPVTAGAFLALFASSAYVVDSLTLDYSAVAFYLGGLLVVIALAAAAARPAAPSRLGILARGIAAAALLALCASGRAGVRCLLPAAVLALTLAAWRSQPEGRRWPAALTGALAFSLVFFAIDGLLTRAVGRLAERTAAAHGSAVFPQRHDLWLSLWAGLGDFDRSKGHVWGDRYARAAVKGRPLMVPRSEERFRALVLRHVGEDPVWWLGILARRAFATTTQWKLRPWAPVDGRSMAPATTLNEGVIDAYYGLTAHVDWFTVGRWRFEVPVWLLLAPTTAAAAVAVRRRSGLALVLGIAALAAVTLPVLVTTAGGVETQAFGLVYFLGCGALADVMARRSAK